MLQQIHFLQTPDVGFSNWILQITHDSAKVQSQCKTNGMYNQTQDYCAQKIILAHFSHVRSTLIGMLWATEDLCLAQIFMSPNELCLIPLVFVSLESKTPSHLHL